MHSKCGRPGNRKRGFKSLHLRSFFVKFFIIKMHNKLDNRCFLRCIIATVKEILQVGFDRGLVKWCDRGLPKPLVEFDSLIPALKNASKALYLLHLKNLNNRRK